MKINRRAVHPGNSLGPRLPTGVALFLGLLQAPCLPDKVKANFLQNSFIKRGKYYIQIIDNTETDDWLICLLWAYIGTPQRRSGNNPVDTPLRWGNRRTQETIAPSSEGHSSVPLSSPSRLAQTSPLAAGMSEMELSSPLNYGTPSSLASATPRSGIRGTPLRQRPDIQPGKRVRQVNLAETVS